MGKYITAFFMAWGNFLAIPCPVKKWDNNLKKDMLRTLPSVGLVVGILWFALALICQKIGLPYILGGFFMTVYIYGITGFFHLDGFMDVRDAIMSRRDLIQRQQILKDPHVGAFGVISVVLLIMGMLAGTSAYLYLTKDWTGWSHFLPFLIIPVISRGEGGMAVLRYRPMATSQYAEAPDREGGRITVPLLQSVIYVIIAIAITLIFGGKGMGRIGEPLIVFLAALFSGVSTRASIRGARKDLGGMNGDIAGCGICVGELVGVLTLPVLLSIYILVNR